MDYEKLIEQLKQKDGLWCSVPTGEKLVTDAADALTALLAENERLKNKLSELAHLPFDNPGVGERTRLMAENAQLRDELEQAKTEITRLKHYEDKCHDCPIVCAKTEIIKAHEELEQIQSENDRLRKERDAAVENIPHECKTCLYHTVSFNGCTPDHDCSNPDGGCSNNYDRWVWRGIKED